MADIKLCIATPVEGDPMTARVCYAPQVLMRAIANAERLDDKIALNYGPGLCGNVDVSRARDRLARIFLEETDCSHLLWWDEDVLPKDLGVIGKMLFTGYDVVGAPYPKKKYPLSYPYRFPGEDGERVRVEVVQGCVEVEAIAFGFTITSRKCLEAMRAHYKADRWYMDIFQGKRYPTVGLFDLLYTPVVDGPDGAPHRVKLSEDYSFCASWRAMGGKIHMYLGDGSGSDTPLGHIGNHLYSGDLESLSNAGG